MKAATHNYKGNKVVVSKFANPDQYGWLITITMANGEVITTETALSSFWISPVRDAIKSAR